MSHSASLNSKYYNKKDKKNADSCLQLSSFGFSWANQAATDSSLPPSTEMLPSTSWEAEKFNDSPSLHKTSKKQEDISDSKTESGQSQQVSTNPESNSWSDSDISTSEPILKKVNFNQRKFENKTKQKKKNINFHLLNMRTINFIRLWWAKLHYPSIFQMKLCFQFWCFVHNFFQFCSGTFSQNS